MSYNCHGSIYNTSHHKIERIFGLLYSRYLSREDERNVILGSPPENECKHENNILDENSSGQIANGIFERRGPLSIKSNSPLDFRSIEMEHYRRTLEWRKLRVYFTLEFPLMRFNNALNTHQLRLRKNYTLNNLNWNCIRIHRPQLISFNIRRLQLQNY